MTAAAPVASPALPQVLLAHHLRQLKLPTFLREYEKVAAEAAPEGRPSCPRSNAEDRAVLAWPACCDAIGSQQCRFRLPCYRQNEVSARCCRLLHE
jgi:hypothetical protein